MSSELAPSDETLVDRARDGDEEAFRLLVDRHVDLLEARVRKRLSDRLSRKVSVADVLQDVYIVAYRRLEDYDRARGAPHAWLLGIADMKAREAIRMFAGTVKRAARGEVSRGHRADTANFAGRGPSPSEAAAESELSERARSAREGLPEDQREVLRLVHEEGLTLREVGERMGRSRESVKKLYGRTICRLRGMLAEEGRHD